MPKQMWPGMTRRQFDGIGEYISHLAGDLGLGDWKLMLVHAPCESDANGYVEPTDHRKRARISLGSDFADLDLDEKRHTLLHELLHLRHRDATDVIRLGLVGQLGNAAFQVLWECFRQQTELWTDGMADVILPMLNDGDYRHLLDR